MTEHTENSDAIEVREPDEAPATGKRLTDDEFRQACDLYETGKATLIEIATNLGISRQALSRRFKDAKIVKSSRLGEEEAAAKKAAVAATERYADKRAEWIEETRLTGVNVLKQSLLLARRTVMENVKASRPPAAIDSDLKALTRFNRLVIDNVEATLRVLNANEHIDLEDLPQLVVSDLTDEDILTHRKNIGILPEDATVEDLLADMMDEDSL